MFLLVETTEIRGLFVKAIGYVFPKHHLFDESTGSRFNTSVYRYVSIRQQTGSERAYIKIDR